MESLEFAESQEAFQREQEAWIARVGLIAGIVSQPIWMVLDWLTQPDMSQIYLGPRVLLIVLALAFLPVVPNLNRVIRIQGAMLGIYLYCGLAAAVTVPLAGDYYSLYVLGFSSVIWAGGCLLAWPAAWCVPLYGGLFALFVGAHVALGTDQSPTSLTVAIGYLVTAIVLSGGSTVGRYRAGARIHQATWALAEQNRELAKSRLEVVETRALSQTKNAFMERMSHELRTPLNAILGYTEMVQEELEDVGQPELAADLNKVTKAGNQLLSLVGDILDLSAIEAGQVPFAPEELDLTTLVQELVREVEPAANDKSVQISLHGPAIQVVHDPARMRQILVSLLSNAVKFTEAGTVDVEVQPRREGGASVAIRDTGIGIDPTQIDRIFDSFHLGDGSTTRRFGGSGLGLAVARGLAESLGGQITVESPTAQGSTFTLQIPREHQPAA